MFRADCQYFLWSFIRKISDIFADSSHFKRHALAELLIGHILNILVLLYADAAVILKTRSCGNKLTDNDVLLESEQVIDLAADRSLAQVILRK